jgi:hypothetical protein
MEEQWYYRYNYWLFGHYPSSSFLFKNVLETGLCPHPQVNAYSVWPL